MLLEVEAKFRVKSRKLLISLLLERGWVQEDCANVYERDHYFQGIGRNFGETGETLRLRIQNGEPRFTYKSKEDRLGRVVKVRREIELVLAECQPCEEHDFLMLLGFKPSAVVRKNRISFFNLVSHSGLSLLVDEIENLGCFVEVEMMVSPEDQMEATQRINRVALELGFEVHEVKSYLAMVLDFSSDGIDSLA